MTDDAPLNADGLGTQIEVSDKLEVSEDTKYSIAGEAQAIAACEQLQEDTDGLIKNAATITHYLNGGRPNDSGRLKQAGRSWYPNTSCRFLKNQCSAIPARIFMPILTASSLTAAELPPGWPLGATKSSCFRDKATRTIRSWPGNAWFWKQLCTEAGYFGYGYAVYFDEWEWRPTFVRMTRGFVPIGTQISDEAGPPLFAVLYDYRVDELLRVVEAARKGGRKDDWELANVAAAINSASPKTENATEHNAREYAEMVRDTTIGESYEKRYPLIQTFHLFSTDPDGSVSHHIMLAPDQALKKANEKPKDEDGHGRLLFERRAQFETMNDVVNPLLFDPETGTIHGSWGAAQHIFDIAQEYERRACDWSAMALSAAKIKVVTDKGVNVDEVRLQVDDMMATLTNAEYRGNVAAVPTDPAPFLALLDFYRAAAGEIIGNYIPPIPLQNSDIKAAQIDAKVKEQQERREQTFQMLLVQIARIVRAIVRRLTKEGTPDEEAKKLIEELKEAGLRDEEIRMLADQPPVNTVFDFTVYAAEKRAAFCMAKAGNPFYNQAVLERTQAEAVGGRGFAESVLMPGDDATVERMAKRQQQLETVAMQAGEVVEVLPIDNDFAHMQELLPKIDQLAFGGGDPNVLRIMVDHSSAHFIGAVNKKGWPKGYSGNREKSFINSANEYLLTGQPPATGTFWPKQDPIGEMEQQLSKQPVLAGPGTSDATEGSQGTREGLAQLMEGSVN